MNLEAGQVGVVLFGSDRLVKEGETVKRTGEIVSIADQEEFGIQLTKCRSTFPSELRCLVVLSMLSETQSMVRDRSRPPRSVVPS